jgi:flagellar motor component MotA
MTKKQKILKLSETLMTLAEKARRDGLLALEEDTSKLRREKGDELLVLGLQLTIDGTDNDIIKTLFNNKLSHIKDPFEYVYANIIKTGVLCIQQGNNPRLIILMIDSVIPDEYKSNDFTQMSMTYYENL